VGSYRWPYSHAHPDCWGVPHVGTVLALDDPEAWIGTLAFQTAEEATPAAVTAHVQRCLAEGLLTTHVPVRWEFGHVWFERRDQLSLAEVDFHNWQTARALRYADVGQPPAAAALDTDDPRASAQRAS
jgi:hypothetical protein